MNGRTPTRSVEEILGVEPADPVELFRDPELRERARVPPPRGLPPLAPDDLIAAFHEAGLGAEAVVPMADVFSHPQFVANGLAATVMDPELGATTQVGFRPSSQRTPARFKVRSLAWASTAVRSCPKPGIREKR